MKNSVIGLSSILAVLLLALCAAAGYYLLGELPSMEVEGTLTSNLGFFLLINLNIIVVMVLGFLLIKNLVKLVLDRRRNILGARLRSRLVAAFVGLSLVPTVLLLMVAKGMLDRGMQEWFSPQIEASIDGALAVAHFHYKFEEERIERELGIASKLLLELHPVVSGNKHSSAIFADEQINAFLSRLLKEKVYEYGLFSLSVLDQDGSALLEVLSRTARQNTVEAPEINKRAFIKALDEGVQIAAEQSLKRRVFAGLSCVKFDRRRKKPRLGERTTGFVGNAVGAAAAKYCSWQRCKCL